MIIQRQPAPAVVSPSSLPDSSRRAALRLVNAAKSYVSSTGSVAVFAGLDLEVFQGEILCLLGPNGCGKSTLLRVLAGLEPLSSGQVLLFDQQVTRPNPRVGIVFQDPLLMPWLTVAQNVGFALRFEVNRSIHDGWERVRRLLDQLGLQRYERAYPWQLSGGIAQRVAIARALLRDPKVILMDEPFAALDPVTRMELQDWLFGIVGGKDVTIVFVTHDAAEALHLGRRIALMSGHPGRIFRTWEVPAVRLARGDLVTSPLYREIFSAFLRVLKS